MTLSNTERQRRYRAGDAGQKWWREYRRRPEVAAAARLRDDEKRAEFKRIIGEAKNQPCADCGVRYPAYVMDFDHVRGTKKFVISKATNHSIKALFHEIAKCDVVCSNCHRERHHGS